MTIRRIVGIDLGIASAHTVRVLDETGATLAKRKAHPTLESLTEVEHAALAGCDEHVRLEVIVEPTGPAWLPIAVFFARRGHLVFRVSSAKASDLRKFFSRHTKTNGIDADTLARLPLVDPGGLQPLQLPGVEHAALDRRVRACDRLTRAAAEHKVRIKDLVRQLLPMTPLTGDLGAADLAVLERWADPNALVKAGLKRLTALIVKASNNHQGGERAEQWLEAARASIELYGGHPAVAFADLAAEVATEVRLLRSIQTELATHAGERETAYRWADPTGLARSLPGLAEVGGPALAAVMGDPGRFAKGKQFRSFTGLTPKASETGDTDRKGQAMSKAGSSLLRTTLIRAADHARKQDPQLARLYYVRRPEMETAEEKLGFLNGSRASALDFEELTPTANGNWLNPGSGEFEQLLPLVPRQGAKCIFSFGANAIKTNRDDWVFDFSLEQLKKKAAFQVERFNAQLRKGTADADSLDYSIKWSSGLKAISTAVVTNDADFVEATWRPFVRKQYFSHKAFSDRLTAHHYAAFGRDLSRKNRTICFVFGSRLEFCAFAIDVPVSYSLLVLDPVYCLSERRHVDGEQSVDNITDWALKQFTAHYKPETGSGKGAKKITKEAIFHYCYAVLHDPLYREKYAQNLKREFPRIPFYADFWQWAAWGEALMALHIGYEQVAPFALTRTDTPDDKARAAGLSPKALLRADPEAGSIALDSETTLRGIPADAWLYKLGNRSALDWVLDQYKEKKPKDPTIREKFDTYRFADYKEKVIDLLMRVTTVSVETVRMTQAMRTVAR